MKSTIVEKDKKYVKYGNKLGFLSMELVDNKLIFDSYRGPDVDLTKDQMKRIADTLLSFAELATPYVPVKIKEPVNDELSIGQKFRAYNIETGLESTSGGVCKVTAIKKASQRNEVMAIDENGNERCFLPVAWTLKAI